MRLNYTLNIMKSYIITTILYDRNLKETSMK